MKFYILKSNLIFSNDIKIIFNCQIYGAYTSPSLIPTSLSKDNDSIEKIT